MIIQPHLRFAYELLKWDEICQQRRGEPIRRELEWATIASEIPAIKKPYSTRGRTLGARGRGMGLAYWRLRGWIMTSCRAVIR